MGRFDLVTFSFGGDDVGFATIIGDCYTGGSKCTDAYVRPRISTLDKQFPTFLLKVAKTAVVAGGNVLVMGYPEVIEDPNLWPAALKLTGHCQGLGISTARSIRGWGGDINAALGSAVKAANAKLANQRNGVHFTFVDVVSGGNGIARATQNLFEPATGTRHELCSNGDQAWLNGLSIHLFTSVLSC
jgi:hypothetical protein